MSTISGPRIDNIEDLNTIDVFNKENKQIDGVTILSRDLVSIKYIILVFKGIIPPNYNMD
jgi:hypothetical protein